MPEYQITLALSFAEAEERMNDVGVSLDLDESDFDLHDLMAAVRDFGEVIHTEVNEDA